MYTKAGIIEDTNELVFLVKIDIVLQVMDSIRYEEFFWSRIRIGMFTTSTNTVSC